MQYIFSEVYPYLRRLTQLNHDVSFALPIAGKAFDLSAEVGGSNHG